MKCWTLVIERNRARLYKKGEYSGNAGIYKESVFKKQGFVIPDKAVPLNLELRRSRTVALWLVDGRTGVALGMGEAEVETTEKMKVVKPDHSQPVEVDVPIYKKKIGSIAIYPVSDPATFVKQNILTKASFYEAIMKKLKVGLIATIIYLCAGGGIFLLALYLIKIIFLKESTL